jgi:hypothetical protein
MTPKLKLTVQKPTINIRRGPNTSAGIVGKATVGQQFDVIQILDTPGSREQWVRVDMLSVADAYICSRLADGTVMCSTGMIPTEDHSADYVRGWNECLDSMHQVLVTQRK